ncbi:MAG: UvrD-helicase domain-containing protein [Candidatus Levybacteria bacterium]|nr:UvrD-helicase domain-containing protein [Candidatus Levybacteria bacterium]
MQQHCSKCGTETDDVDDLHCRKILRDKVKDLLSIGLDEAAKKLVEDTKGNVSWVIWKWEMFERLSSERRREIDLLELEEAEKLEKKRKASIIETLAPAQLLLNNGNFFDADQFVLEKHSEELIEEYEKMKFECIKTDLRELEKELGEKEGYFDDEKATVLSTTGKDILVQARAGSGKTTTIALRVRQLIKFYRAKPEEILVLAFNKKAARGFEVQINKYCHANVVDKSNALTFHSLAYRLVNPGEWLLFNDPQDNSEFIRGQQSEFIGRIYDQILAKDRGIILTLLYNFFKALAKEKMSADFNSEADFYLYRRNLQYVSLGGERVKSKGEKFIADFLFERKIFRGGQELEYKYEWNLPGGVRRYKPDFSLWFLNRVNGEMPLAILEHFGVTERHPADRDYMSEDEERNYLQEMNWKRTYCEQNNVLFLSTSVDDFDGTTETNERESFEQDLNGRLERSGLILQKLNQGEIINKMLEARANLDQLFDQITQFISRAKKQSLTPSDIQSLAESRVSTLGERSKNFIKIVRRVYERYQDSLREENKIDFDDLLARATDKINQPQSDCELEILGENRKIKDIKYILIDEYQDFSKLFYKLIDAIRSSNPAISVFSVGDDWQAINGFAGSDLEYFDNFETYFVDGRRTSLLTNYRSCANIVQHSNLLMSGRGLGGKPEANKLPGGVYLSPTQHVEWRIGEEYGERYQEDEDYRIGAQVLGGWQNKRIEMSRYLKTVGYIVRGKVNKKICLLFRTNSLYGVGISEFTEKIREWCPNQDITSSTAHSFKGKESDVIIVVDANRSSYPKIHPDNELMELLGVTMSKVLEEERRLFYVAITRATEELYLLYEEEIGHSDFIFPERWQYLPI